MHLILFTTRRDGLSDRLQRIIQESFPREKLETYRTIGSLSRRLHRPMNGLSIAVLEAQSIEELKDLVSFHDLFLDIRIILILPDRERKTISNAHKLRPRFLAYADSDFEPVKVVLDKMLGGLR